MTAFLERYWGAFSESKEKRGHNTKVEFAFTRHEIPGKTPEGMSADFIVPEGLDRAKATGKKEDAEYLLVMGSHSVKRARETGKSYMEGVNEAGLADIINKEGAEGNKLKEYGVYAMPDLNPVKDAGKVLTPILAEGKKLVAEGKLDAKGLEGWAINKYMGLPDEKFKEQGVPTPRETAAEMVHRLSSGLKMSEQLFEGIDVKVNNFTHGPKLECLMKFVLKNGDKTGFESLDEIGGSIKPGESIEFSIQRDENGELKPIKLKLRGQEHDMDMGAFKQLLEEYKANKQKK